ncbi:hypothetical protein [Oleiharenicola sp. Vm1]|uniref:hypothetical protein n=1 Tax=Oleiharenicola sp. Vm1 TaxID=3398393 RepID=UPI0039F4E660
MWARALAIFALIALVETIHGSLRVRFLNRPLGDQRARQVGVFTGSALILLIAWLTTPWLAVPSAAAAWAVGGAWLSLMLAFEVWVGRGLFHASWPRVFADFDLRRGGLLGFGLLVLAAAPWLAGVARGRF